MFDGGERLDRLILRENAICKRDRSRMVKENEIESMFSNT